MEAKYKIDEFVMPVLDDSGTTKMQVIEINKQTCPAGIEQITYTCRVSVKSQYRETSGIAKDYFRFN